jgi:16S rRNA (guanine527-N7)-methyltransferase
LSAALAELLEAAGVEPRLVAPLARYAELVLEANRSFNLTGAKSPADFVPHVLDSLAAAPFAGGTLVDVGSGAGLPAIPIAIATGAPVTLVEATAKKARFLQSALSSLGLAGEVVCERAESVAHDPRLRDAFASGTARAVASVTTVAELLLPFIAPGGVAILQRGALEEAERAALADAALVLGAEVAGEHPAGDRRCIVVLRKLTATPPRFPRRSGIPHKRPLCM